MNESPPVSTSPPPVANHYFHTFNTPTLLKESNGLDPLAEIRTQAKTKVSELKQCVLKAQITVNNTIHNILITPFPINPLLQSLNHLPKK